MNILILAAGQPPAHQDGYPLCLTEFDSVPLIQRIITSCSALSPRQLIVALREEDVRNHHLENIVTLLSPDAKVVHVHGATQGAACTALLATSLINNEDQLLIINGNDLLNLDYASVINDFRQRQMQAGVVVFHSIHPRYSYVRVGEADLVVEAAEKKPISTHATAGFYWFLKGCDFISAAKQTILKEARVNGKFYICPTFNELILMDRRVGIYRATDNAYHPLKTDRQIEQFEANIDRGQKR